LENSFIERAVGDAFDGKVPEVRNRAALRDPAIEELVACLRREMDEAGQCSRLCLDFMGTSLAVRLFATYGESAISPPMIRGGLSGSRRRRVIDYIDAHLSEDISLAVLAAEAGLSPHHFGKAFKTSLGAPPCQYVTRRRIAQAMDLLLNTSRSITEIAYEIGFPNHSHFCGMFRKVTGTTPSQFRKDCS
jgi:AraC family transcriptional regulator